jgi:hypothetical protein
MYIWIVGWVRAGFRDCLFQAIMVGEPASTNNPSIKFKFNSQMYIWIVGWVRAGFRDCLFQAMMVGEPAPTGIRFI